MMIVAIDPSFTSTGVAVLDDIVRTYRVGEKGHCYSSLVDNHALCSYIESNISSEFNSDTHIICEYPVFNSRSGAYLAILNGYFAASWMNNANVQEIVWIPPMACDSFIKNKEHSKSFIVNWCKIQGLVSSRVNHDEATALVLLEIYRSIKMNKYKNSYFVWQRR